MTQMQPLTFGSLFAGIGGIDLGFERAGMVCKWQVEIDDYARRVLAKHWPNVPRFEDVRDFPPKLEPSMDVDVICGGFPCQDVSSANVKSEYKGLFGSKTGLIWEMLRVVRLLRPKFVLMENSPEIVVRGWVGGILGPLAELGYDAQWCCLRPPGCHDRNRLFITAYADGQGKSFGTFNAEVARIRTIADARSFVQSIGSTMGSNDGVPNRMDRLRGLGNAVVPQVAEFIGRMIVAQHERSVRRNDPIR